MKTLENLHILIAEDDFDDATVISESFKKHALFSKVETVFNGQELLNHLNNKLLPIPDIILTDLNMPIINGLEVLKSICQDSQFREILLFAYSTSVNPFYQAKCLQFGAKAFLSKPYDFEEFEKIPDEIIKIIKTNHY